MPQLMAGKAIDFKPCAIQRVCPDAADVSCTIASHDMEWEGSKAHMLIGKPHAAPMCRLQQRCRGLCILVDGADCMNDMLGSQLEAPASITTQLC